MNTILVICCIVVVILFWICVLLFYKYSDSCRKWILGHKLKTVGAVVVSSVLAAGTVLLPVGDVVVDGVVADVVHVWFTSSGKNAYFTTNTSLSFNPIVVDEYYIQFNTTGFNISSANRVNVTVMKINSSIAGASGGDLLVDCYVNGSGTVWFNISGFTAGDKYDVNRSGVLVYTPIANSSGFISFSNDVWSERHFEIYKSVSVVYDTTIRTDGIDYFVWMGKNDSAYNVSKEIESDCGITWSTDEFISIWNESGSWNADWYVKYAWYQYFPSNDSGNNFTVNTYDVIWVSITDDVGDVTITMAESDVVDYSLPRSVVLSNATRNRGGNFTGYTNISSTFLGSGATVIGMATGEVLSLWNETTYVWDSYVVGFWTPVVYLHQFDVVASQVGTTRTWSIGSVI